MSKVVWIDTASQLDVFCEQLRRYEVIAVDTESDHFFAYHPFSCLIQVGVPGETALVDPLALSNEAMAPLFDIFEDPSIEKIVHSANNDLLELNRDYGVELRNLFDTQLAAEFLRYEKTSLSWLLENLYEVKLSKKYQRYDWRRRPISAPARAYAADDVVYLFELRDFLWGELKGDGWDDAFAESCEYLCDYVRFKPKVFDPDGWRRIKTKIKLDGRGRAAVKALFELRHEICESLDQAPLHVMDNAAIMWLADKRPSSKNELKKVSMPHHVLKKYGSDILDTIESSLDDEVPPKRRPSTTGPRDLAFEARLADLKAWRNDTSESYGIPPGLVANNALLTVLARRLPDEPEVFDETPEMLAWRVRLFKDEIFEVCVNAK